MWRVLSQVRLVPVSVLGISVLGMSVMGLAFSGPAEAVIACHEGYQTVAGQQISTPYCNDAYLAQVAREYGAKATADAVRGNPAFKNELCRFVGSDPRISNYCPDDGSSSGRGR